MGSWGKGKTKQAEDWAYVHSLRGWLDDVDLAKPTLQKIGLRSDANDFQVHLRQRFGAGLRWTGTLCLLALWVFLREVEYYACCPCSVQKQIEIRD